MTDEGDEPKDTLATGSRPGDDVPPDAPELAGDGVKRKKKSSWHELPVLVLIAIALSLLIRTFLVQAFYIPSESMEKTLRGCEGCRNNDRVLVWKLGARFGDPDRGDIVVFDGTGSFGPKDYIKRVIGLPGETVACCDAEGRVTVNGVALDEPYVYEDNHSEFDTVVPAGELWLMGDHRSASSDSRVHGTVPIDRVVGKAFVIVWPPSRAGVLN
ncbi:MAG: signal peptidase I [Mycobacteriales bacterium]